MPFEIKKRKNPIIIAAVTLNKDPFKATSSHTFIIIFNIRLEYGLRKIIILIHNNSEKKLHFTTIRKRERFDRRSNKMYKNFIDGYTVTIYRKYDLII
jgi:hypothetical protein